MTAPNLNPGGFNGGDQHVPTAVVREQARAAVIEPLKAKIAAQLRESHASL